MKSNYLILAIITFILFSCNGASGNKSIIPVDNSLESNIENKNEEPKELKYSLTFTAFKTPEKIGVEGSFKDIKLTNTKKEASSLEEMLNGSLFSINTTSVSTNDAGRDEKLMNFFFGKLAENTISGNFGKFENSKVPVKIKMNGKEKEIIMNYISSNQDITLKGTIDIIKDFEASTALESINQACFDLHQGKTWSDVNIEIKINK